MRSRNHDILAGKAIAFRNPAPYISDLGPADAQGVKLHESNPFTLALQNSTTRKERVQHRIRNDVPFPSDFVRAKRRRDVRLGKTNLQSHCDAPP